VKSGAARWLGAAFLTVMVPYVWLAAYIHPGADDFTYALTTQRDGYWRAFRDQYLMWNGRYTSNLFELAGPMVWRSLVWYRIVAVVVIAATFAAAFSIVRAVAGRAWTREQAVVCALGLTALDLAGLPALGENIYWYTSSATYQLSSVLILLQIALALPMLCRDARAGWVRKAAAAVLLVAVSGMNEVAMLLIAGFYAVVAALGFVEQRPRAARTAAVMFGGVVAAGLAVWLAPGNAVRTAMYPVRHEVVRSAVLTMVQTARFGVEWATAGSLLLASILFLPLGAAIARADTALGSISRRGAVTLVAGAFATIPIAVFPPYWATGLLGQHRTIAVAYSMFLPLWFAALTALVSAGWLPTPGGWLLDRRVRLAAAVLLVASLAFTHNGYRVAVDLAYGRPAAFDRETSARDAALRTCGASHGRDATCLVAPIVTRPESLFVLDVSADPTDWVNAAYAAYFGVGRVIAAPARGPR